MDVNSVRTFLNSHNSYFKQSVADVDGVLFDASTVIMQAALKYNINPKVILATLEKENNGISRSTRPSDTTLKFLMGCVSQSTARDQLTCTAERFKTYNDQLTSTGSTVSGWKVGIPKQTLDDVAVTPATKAVAGQFTYTPYAGVQWGGNDPRWGGVHLFYNYWNSFSFADDPVSQNPKLVVYRTNVVGSNYRDSTWIALDKNVDGLLEGYGYSGSVSKSCSTSLPVVLTAPDGSVVRKYSSTTMYICVGKKYYKYTSADSDASKAVLSAYPTSPYTTNKQEISKTC